uniref:Pentatricopeptide repeat-containing protein At4g31070 n=1 Tax=Rhizophora mucronata TaxID=61149 RepID=A0A2P2QM71_RHIMU
MCSSWLRAEMWLDFCCIYWECPYKYVFKMWISHGITSNFQRNACERFGFMEHTDQQLCFAWLWRGSIICFPQDANARGSDRTRCNHVSFRFISLQVCWHCQRGTRNLR